MPTFAELKKDFVLGDGANMSAVFGSLHSLLVSRGLEGKIITVANEKHLEAILLKSIGYFAVIDGSIQMVICIIEVLGKYFSKTKSKILQTVGREVLSQLVADDGAYLLLPRFRSRTILSGHRLNLAKLLNNLLLGTCKEARLKFRDTEVARIKRIPKILKEIGDFDAQITLTELLFRVYSKNSPSAVDIAKSWFKNLVLEKFLAISKQSFEVDCREFLNEYNLSLGAEAKVHTYECQKLEVGDRVVVKPRDEGYNRFWVDFNEVSQSVLVFCANSSQEDVWDAMIIRTHDIESLNITQGDSVQIVQISLLRQAYLLFDSSSVSEFPGLEVKLTFSRNVPLRAILSKVFGKVVETVDGNQQQEFGSESSEDIIKSSQKSRCLDVSVSVSEEKEEYKGEERRVARAIRESNKSLHLFNDVSPEEAKTPEPAATKTAEITKSSAKKRKLFDDTSNFLEDALSQEDEKPETNPKVRKINETKKPKEYVPSFREAHQITNSEKPARNEKKSAATSKKYQQKKKPKDIGQGDSNSKLPSVEGATRRSLRARNKNINYNEATDRSNVTQLSASDEISNEKVENDFSTNRTSAHKKSGTYFDIFNTSESETNSSLKLGYLRTWKKTAASHSTKHYGKGKESVGKEKVSIKVNRMPAGKFFKEKTTIDLMRKAPIENSGPNSGSSNDDELREDVNEKAPALLGWNTSLESHLKQEQNQPCSSAPVKPSTGKETTESPTPKTGIKRTPGKKVKKNLFPKEESRKPEGATPCGSQQIAPQQNFDSQDGCCFMSALVLKAVRKMIREEIALQLKDLQR